MELLENKRKAWLILADGTIYEGLSMGAQGETIGEVVFTTGMTGYQETLTDPSYYGQIVTQTFPLIGNYGVNSEDGESDKSYVRGYIVREWCETPSNFRCEHTIDWFLKEHNIIGIYDIDTRALTRKLREHGVMNGMITTTQPQPPMTEIMEKLRAFEIKDAIKSVTITEPREYKSERPQCRVALLDYGYKRNIRRSLLKRGCDLTIVPALTSPADLMAFDGIMLSNGPGDPEENKQVIDILRALAKTEKPVFGICLGHQLMALAQGAKTAKLKYGHRGGNQPVIDLKTGRTFVTSQNHGYEVLGDTVPADIGEVSHVNANDRSCEGVRYFNSDIFTVQFHPEACGGPRDTGYLFDEFLNRIMKKKEGC